MNNTHSQNVKQATHNFEVVKVSAPEWKRKLFLAVERVWGIIRLATIEASEVVSIFSSLCWAIPLLLDPTYLTTSIYLRSLGANVEHSALLLTVIAMFWWQLGAIIVGGSPSGFINNSRDTLFWLRIRQLGMLGSGSVWAGIAYSLTIDRIGVGTLIWGFIATFCAYGFWRLGLLIMVEKIKAEYAAKEEEGKELSLEGANG